MHTLGRVKDTSIAALIELIHLVLHLQVGVHAKLRLGLHLEGGVHARDLWINRLSLNGLLDVFDALLVWLHLIKMFLILPLQFS